VRPVRCARVPEAVLPADSETKTCDLGGRGRNKDRLAANRSSLLVVRFLVCRCDAGSNHIRVCRTRSVVPLDRRVDSHFQ